jgi:hypothetical protein
MATNLIDQLAATPKALAMLAVEATDAMLDAAVDGGWSGRTVLAHLRDDEYLCMRVALERMLAEDEPSLHFIEGGDWEPARNRTRDRKEWILADFALHRQASLTILRGLRPEDWQRRGRVASGSFSVEQLAERWVEHDAEHIAQLERAVGETLAEVTERRKRMAEGPFDPR